MKEQEDKRNRVRQKEKRKGCETKRKVKEGLRTCRKDEYFEEEEEVRGKRGQSWKI